MNKVIRYKDCSAFIKISLVGGFAFAVWFTALFIYGFIIAI